VVLALAGLALPKLAAVRLTDHALASWSARPAQALEELRLAARIDPLSARAPLALGIVAVDQGRLADAAGGLRAAAQRDGSDWFARYAAGLVARARGQRVAADRWLAEARRRNPREPLVVAAATAGVGPREGIRRALTQRG
jgi:tetratricopeptide (TPR) repeat protein